MNEDEILYFIKNYKESDIDYIKFIWNGKHGQDLEDPNMKFRLNICELILKKGFAIVNDTLLLHLYQELSNSSVETWSVYYKYHEFAQEMLNRDPQRFLLHYLSSSKKSFDTLLASGNVTLSENTRIKVKEYIKAEIKQSKNIEITELLYWAAKRFNLELDNKSSR